MAEEPVDTNEMKRVTRKAAIRVLAVWLILPLFFLITGGSLRWWEAWVYCALLLVPMTAFMIWMIRRDPVSLARRFKMREKERTQRRLVAWGFPLMLAIYLLPGLDHRFDWSATPLAAVLLAMLLIVFGYAVIIRVFLENRWAGRTIETYTEQRVVSTGPYAIVRHPMYTGSILLYLATPVALGSWWGIVPALAYVPIIVLRIRNEEEVLLRELSGYQEYRQRVRYRLVPCVW